MPVFGGQGVTASLHGNGSNVVELQAGQTIILGEPAFSAGWYQIQLGKYTQLQQLDPILGIWRNIGGGYNFGGVNYVYSDGVNYRLANQTGCAVGAYLTNAGSAYTSAPVVTPSAGGSIWRAIVGGVVNATVTVTNGGSNYTYRPMVVFSTPPIGGIQATGYCTLTAGAVSSVTVVDQGAGYTSPPTISFFNDPREGLNNLPTGTGAQAVATLTGANTVSGVVCLDHGSALTSIPTLAFSGGGGSSAAAIAIMCWTVTGYTVGTAGAGLSGTATWLSAIDPVINAAATAYANPTTQANLVLKRPAQIVAPTSAGGITATGLQVWDGGIYAATGTPLVLANASVTTTAPVANLTFGGANDISYVTPC
jgi:hypothetical protein